MTRHAPGRPPHAGRRRHTIIRAVVSAALLAAMLGLAGMLLCSLSAHWPRSDGFDGGQWQTSTTGLAEEEGARFVSHGPLKDAGGADAGGPPGSGGAAGETAGNNRQAAAAVDMDSAWGVLLAAVKARQQQRQGPQQKGQQQQQQDRRDDVAAEQAGASEHGGAGKGGGGGVGSETGSGALLGAAEAGASLDLFFGVMFLPRPSAGGGGGGDQQEGAAAEGHDSNGCGETGRKRGSGPTVFDAGSPLPDELQVPEAVCMLCLLRSLWQAHSAPVGNVATDGPLSSSSAAGVEGGKGKAASVFLAAEGEGKVEDHCGSHSGLRRLREVAAAAAELEAVACGGSSSSRGSRTDGGSRGGRGRSASWRSWLGGRGRSSVTGPVVEESSAGPSLPFVLVRRMTMAVLHALYEGEGQTAACRLAIKEVGGN